MGLHLLVLPETLAVCRLGPDAAMPDWATGGAFFSITRSREELSVVVEEGRVPAGVMTEGGWRVLKVAGPISFDAVGILVSITGPLAQANIGLFAVSTFDTDYILVKADRLEAARAALAQAGHTIQ
jgi:uncharacterized protein